MGHGIPAALLIATFCGPASGETIVVSTLAEGGAGSLRAALEASNVNGEPDVIRFASGLSGTIEVSSALPALCEGDTRIDGDTTGNGRANITLDGLNCKGWRPDGLRVTSDGNVISRLIVKGFPRSQIRLNGASGNTVKACWVNTDASGDAPPARGDGIVILGGSGNRIGVPGQRRNVILGVEHCLQLVDTSSNRIQGNLIGTNASGSRDLVPSAVGVALVSVTGRTAFNVLGGATRECRNNVAGRGIVLSGARTERNRVLGCYVGFRDQGTSPLGGLAMLQLEAGANRNIIGGARDQGGNAIFGGVLITGQGTGENSLTGNYIGLNALGTGNWPGRPLGITVEQGAGRQYIGGDTPEFGNYVTARYFYYVIGFHHAGDGSVVRNNTIGIDVNGDPTGGPAVGVFVNGADVAIDSNLIAAMIGRGIYVHEGSPVISGNTFDRNPVAITIGSLGTPVIGNLGNGRSDDDGGNHFLASNKWCIRTYNYDGQRIMAEGNDFGTSLPSMINARIWDGRDEPGLGKVDFRPFVRSPSAAGASALTISSVSVAPTNQGAEVVFSLSSVAAVTCSVRNISGRTMCAICTGRPYVPGSHAMVWDGRASSGTRAPSGRYWVEIIATSRDGAQAHALAPIWLSR